MSKRFPTALYVGDVWHKRQRPKTHAFRYPIYYLMLDLDAFSVENPKLPKGLSLNRLNVFSVHEKDYGARGATPLKEHICSLIEGNISGPASRIMMLTMPRLLGYSFNPITVYFCLSETDHLLAVVYEVHNTFGETHSYVYCAQTDEDTIPVHCADKSFHVSPFYPVEGEYRFRVREQADKLGLSIKYFGKDGKLDLTACLTAAALPLTAANLLRLFLKIPLVTFKVTAAIHYEALRLWIKRLSVFSKPKQAALRTQFTRLGQTRSNGG